MPSLKHISLQIERLSEWFEELQDEFKDTCSKSGLEGNFSWRLEELKSQESGCKRGI